VGQDVFSIEVSRSYSVTPHSLGLLWTNDQPDAEPCTCRHTSLKTDIHPCLPAEFEPAIPASEGPQTHTVDGAVTDIGKYYTFTLRKFTKHRVTTLFSPQDSVITTKQQKLPTAPWRSTIEDLSAEVTVRTRHSFCTSRWSRADPCKHADVPSSTPVPV
jgi:hypothetical protein